MERMLANGGRPLTHSVSVQTSQKTQARMASNVVTLPDITSWWFRRILGPDLITCSSITLENDRKDLEITPIESAILSPQTKESESACEVIGLYFTPVNSCVDEGNLEDFTSKLVDLYNRVNYHCESKCGDNNCCNNHDAGKQNNENNCRENVGNRSKNKKLEIIHVVLPPGGGVSGGGANLVSEQGADIFEEADFRKIVKDMPWFAIPYRDIHRMVSNTFILSRNVYARVTIKKSIIFSCKFHWRLAR